MKHVEESMTLPKEYKSSPERHFDLKEIMKSLKKYKMKIQRKLDAIQENTDSEAKKIKK